MQPIIIYHAQCPDGFGAAYAAWRKYGADAQYVPAQHGRYPTLDELKVDGREVFILDFSFPREQLEALAGRAKSVVVLDHHKTAQTALEGFPGAVFDMSKSGARLAWEHFHPTTPVPRLLECIEDRDLWRWKLAESAEVLSYVDTLPFDFVEWDRLAQMSKGDWEQLIGNGAQMNRKFQSVAKGIARSAEPVCFCGVHGHKVNVGACDTLMVSQVGEYVYEENGTFALLWRIEKGMLLVSLRAKQGTVDVSAMAERFGGGGHPASSGFALPLKTGKTYAFLDHYILNAGEDDAFPA